MMAVKCSSLEVGPFMWLPWWFLQGRFGTIVSKAQLSLEEATGSGKTLSVSHFVQQLQQVSPGGFQVMLQLHVLISEDSQSKPCLQWKIHPLAVNLFEILYSFGLENAHFPGCAVLVWKPRG